MHRTTTFGKVLLIGLLVLLMMGQAIPVSAGINVWTSLGPEGGHILALTIDPQDPATIYAGTEEQGVFKSTDGGAHWSAVNTGLTRTYISALAIDPNNPSTLYAGTQGGGVFKSTDGGVSWRALNTGLAIMNVNTLVIDPQSSTTLYAGTTGGGVFSIQQRVGTVYLPLVLRSW